MNLHIKSPGEAPGVYPIVERGKGLKHLSFTVVRLGGSFREYSFESGTEELSLDSYSGPVSVEVEHAGGRWVAEFPPRPSLAEAAPMIYVPAASRVQITALDGAAHLAIGGALGKSGARPALIQGDRVLRSVVGKGTFSRLVLTHIGADIDAARLIAGETISTGNWSSFPPHKHDRLAPPSECPMEEVYYFLIEPPDGFSFIRVYTGADDSNPFDCAFAVEHGDTVLIPRGYHPVATCPGYTLNYTWVLAGEGRTYGAWSDDPRYSWIRQL